MDCADPCREYQLGTGHSRWDCSGLPPHLALLRYVQQLLLTCWGVIADLSGIKHYSGPIKAVTKWETGVEIDLQSAITTQRSRPTDPGADADYFGPTDPGSKARGTIPVFVQTADDSERQTSTRGTGGTGSEWTDATASSASGQTATRAEMGSDAGMEMRERLDSEDLRGVVEILRESGEGEERHRGR